MRKKKLQTGKGWLLGSGAREGFSFFSLALSKICYVFCLRLSLFSLPVRQKHPRTRMYRYQKKKRRYYSNRESFKSNSNGQREPDDAGKLLGLWRRRSEQPPDQVVRLVLAEVVEVAAALEDHVARKLEARRVDLRLE